MSGLEHCVYGVRVLAMRPHSAHSAHCGCHQKEADSPFRAPCFEVALLALPSSESRVLHAKKDLPNRQLGQLHHTLLVIMTSTPINPIELHAFTGTLPAL